MKRKFNGNTEHVNALLKLVKGKGMILQIDAANRLNRKDINRTAQKLEEEGKIKRQKVKLRQQFGNLVDVWLLYMPGTDQNDILEYEKELINRPFESPLKEHHCYKKVEQTEMEIVETENESNIVPIKDYIKISNNNLEIKMYNNQRVVTSQDIALLHNKTVKAINQQLERNKKHFINDEDYFIITRNSKVTDCDFQECFTSPRQKELYLFTESGYMMLVKSFTDDLSWTVQRQLVNTYFKMKEIQQDPELNNRPQIQSLERLDILKLMVDELQEQKNRIESLENKFNNLVNAITQ